MKSPFFKTKAFVTLVFILFVVSVFFVLGGKNLFDKKIISESGFVSVSTSSENDIPAEKIYVASDGVEYCIDTDYKKGTTPLPGYVRTVQDEIDICEGIKTIQDFVPESELSFKEYVISRWSLLKLRPLKSFESIGFIKDELSHINNLEVLKMLCLKRIEIEQGYDGIPVEEFDSMLDDINNKLIRECEMDVPLICVLTKENKYRASGVVSGSFNFINQDGERETNTYNLSDLPESMRDAAYMQSVMFRINKYECFEKDRYRSNTAIPVVGDFLVVQPFFHISNDWTSANNIIVTDENSDTSYDSTQNPAGNQIGFKSSCEFMKNKNNGVQFLNPLTGYQVAN